jgi:hypothetical protein
MNDMRLLVAFPLLLVPCQGEAERRYEIETLYVIHRRVTSENYQRIEALFAKAHPDFDLAKLRPVDKDMREYYAIYRDRLLKAAAGTNPELIDPEKGLELVRGQIDRELRVRAIFDHLLAEARREGSLRAVFDRLAGKDDAARSICATEPAKGLLVYRHVVATAKGLEDLEDEGLRFGLDFRVSVLQAVGEELPAFARRPYVLGKGGEGRHVFRLLKIHRDDPIPEGN